MSVIKKAQKQAEKEAKRAIQYPRQPEALEEVKPTPTENEVELSYNELRAKAKGLGLKASGSKKDLLERIAGA